MKLIYEDHTLELLNHDRDEQILIWTVKGLDFEFDAHVAYWDPVCIVDIVVGSDADSDGVPIAKHLPIQQFSALCKATERRFRLHDATRYFLSENGYEPPSPFRIDPDAMRKDRLDMLDERGAP